LRVLARLFLLVAACALGKASPTAKANSPSVLMPMILRLCMCLSLMLLCGHDRSLTPV
jgi:hypothetical protein